MKKANESAKGNSKNGRVGQAETDSRTIRRADRAAIRPRPSLSRAVREAKTVEEARELFRLAGNLEVCASKSAALLISASEQLRCLWEAMPGYEYDKEDASALAGECFNLAEDLVVKANGLLQSLQTDVLAAVAAESERAGARRAYGPRAAAVLVPRSADKFAPGGAK